MAVFGVLSPDELAARLDFLAGHGVLLRDRLEEMSRYWVVSDDGLPGRVRSGLAPPATSLLTNRRVPLSLRQWLGVHAHRRNQHESINSHLTESAFSTDADSSSARSDDPSSPGARPARSPGLRGTVGHDGVAQSGMFPCFRTGRFSCFVFRNSSARISIGRGDRNSSCDQALLAREE